MERMFVGALAGVAAWPAMDLTLRVLDQRENPEARRREDAARGGIPAMEVLGVRLARGVGVELSSAERQRAGKIIQWVMGVGGGLLYAGVRPHFPFSGVRRGLAFGGALSLFIDEGLTRVLRLAPSPWAFPWQTHARGVIGHLVYGVVLEQVMRTVCESE